jgi:hypothetical protein
MQGEVGVAIVVTNVNNRSGMQQVSEQHVRGELLGRRDGPPSKLPRLVCKSTKLMLAIVAL